MRIQYLLAILLTATTFASDPKPPHITVDGDIDNPIELTASDLRSMSRIKVPSHDRDGDATFEGVRLSDIVKRAKPRLGEKPMRGTSRGTVLVKGADGYQVVFSLVEIDPDFNDNNIILADQRNGKPLPDPQGPFQIIAPNDKIHARWVRQVVALKIFFQTTTKQ
jgi:DMSO/TMAO reductase YedYZ molybdopterin-dependent catalytic subunit